MKELLNIKENLRNINIFKKYSVLFKISAIDFKL